MSKNIYEQLNSEEIRLLYQRMLQEYRTQASDFYTENGGILRGEERNKALSLLTNFFIISATLGVDSRENLKQFIPLLNTPEEMRKTYTEFYTLFHKYKEKLDNTIQNGKALRAEVNPFYPEILRHGRVYFRVPDFMGADKQIRLAIDEFNQFLPEQNKIRFEKDNLIIGNQKQKSGRFLLDQVSKISSLLEYLNELSPAQKEELIQRFQQEDTVSKILEMNGSKKTVLWFNEFQDTYPASVKRSSLSPLVFFLIKKGLEKGEKDLGKILIPLRDRFESLNNSLSYEAGKRKTFSTNSSIDTLIFSISPRDIARMSAYTHYDETTCMNPTDPNHRFVIQDIGRGTIVVYGVNSEKPNESLSRILLKPYWDEYGNVIYGVGKTYGDQNNSFFETVRKITETHLNHPKKGKTFHLSPFLYQDSEETIIRRFFNIQEYCQEFNIPSTPLRNGGVQILGMIRTSFLEREKEIDFSQMEIEKFMIDTLDFPRTLPRRMGHLSISSRTRIPSKIDFSNVSSLFLSQKDLSKSELIMGENLKKINLSEVILPALLDLRCLETVIFWKVDLSKTKIIFGDNLKEVSFVSKNLPSDLDLRSCQKITLWNCDLSQTNLLLGKDLETINLSQATAPPVLDLSTAKKACLERTDLSRTEITFNPNAVSINLTDAKLPKVLDFSSIKSSSFLGCRLIGCDFRMTDQIILPPEGSFDLKKFTGLENVPSEKISYAPKETGVFFKRKAPFLSRVQV